MAVLFMIIGGAVVGLAVWGCAVAIVTWMLVGNNDAFDTAIVIVGVATYLIAGGAVAYFLG